MEEHKEFLEIYKTPTLWTRITKKLSFPDICNLSLTCKTYLEAIGAIKKEEDRLVCRDFSSKLYIQSKNDIDATKYLYENVFDNKNINVDYKRIFNCIIHPESLSLTKEEMKGIGEKINNLLNKIPTIKELSINVNLEEHYDDLLVPLIKQINNKNVKVINIGNVQRGNVINEYHPFLITNSEIFDGFSNLTTIRIHPNIPTANNIDERLIDIASKIKGITIEANFNEFVKTEKCPDKFLKNYNSILSYIIRKGIFLKVVGIYFKGFSFKLWLGKWNDSQLALLKSIQFETTSIATLRQISAFLPKMVNLESLGIHFVMNLFSMQVEMKFLEILKKSKKFTYPTMKDLKNLKTVKFTVDFVTNIPEEIQKKLIMDEDFSDIQNESLKKQIKTFKTFREIYQKEILEFLSVFPNNVKNLYLSKFNDVEGETFSLLTNYFPEISFLFLDRIAGVEEDCLNKFKKIKFFVYSYLKQIIKLPKTVELFAIFAGNNKNIKMEGKSKYVEICNLYKGLERERFTKVCKYQGCFEGTIFYTYYHTLYSFRKYFVDIGEMPKYSISKGV